MTLDEIVSITSRMRVGDVFVVRRHELKMLGGDNFFTGETVIDRLKSNIIGSAWEFVVEKDLMTGDLFIKRIQPDGKRRHVDHDRRHLYNRESDGTFTRNNIEFRPSK